MNEDILKLFVVWAASYYFNLKIKARVSRGNLWIISMGLILLLGAAFLDFTDGFPSLNHVFILGKEYPWHDFLEDQVFDTPGLALLILGTFRELSRLQTIYSREP